MAEGWSHTQLAAMVINGCYCVKMDSLEYRTPMATVAHTKHYLSVTILMITLSTVPQIVLSINDLDLIYSLVKEDSANWNNIGLKLEFQEGELTEIQSIPVLIVQGTAGYLKELLTRWLKLIKPLPYLHVLAEAIYNAGNERLGSELVAKYLLATKQK